MKTLHALVVLAAIGGFAVPALAVDLSNVKSQAACEAAGGADPPAKGFWSVTAYDEGTRQMQVTEQGRPDISSRKEDIVKNDDGSIDVYFGPEAPEGHEANWVQTNPDKGWFAYFRFYGPTEPFFDKSWALPDIEKVKD